MITTILSMLIVGAIAGFVARLLVRNDGVSGILPTIVLGIVGSFIGGFLGYILFGHDAASGALQTSGIMGSIVGAVLAVLAYRTMNRRGVTA